MHGLNALYEADRVQHLGGEPELVDTPSVSGKGQRIARCPTCKVAVVEVAFITASPQAGAALGHGLMMLRLAEQGDGRIGQRLGSSAHGGAVLPDQAVVALHDPGDATPVRGEIVEWSRLRPTVALSSDIDASRVDWADFTTWWAGAGKQCIAPPQHRGGP